MMSRKNSDIVIYTIGHSNREKEEFTGLLQKNKIRTLVDIRRLPGSAKYPHFNQDELSMSLDSLGILYVHLKELGGRRKQTNSSQNTIWKNKSFQAYADYMDTDEFRKGIDILLEQAAKQRTAIMCSEAVWWRCHRALVADYLKSNGIEVYHIVNAAAPKLHPYTSAARIRGGKLYYFE